MTATAFESIMPITPRPPAHQRPASRHPALHARSNRRAEGNRPDNRPIKPNLRHIAPPLNQCHYSNNCIIFLFMLY